MKRTVIKRSLERQLPPYIRLDMTVQVNQKEVVDIVHVHSVSPDIPISYMALTVINKISITMEPDTEAPLSIISEQI